MVFTVTFNPALDYVIRVPDFVPGRTNRSMGEDLQVGGKGINVAFILGQLGVEAAALGFLAGDTGKLLRDRVEVMGVKADFISLPAGFTRINVKLKSGEETELNGKGPDIPPQALEELLRKLDVLRDGDTLVLSGSIPPSLPADVYERILSRLSGRGIRFVVDATGELLERVLPYRPFLIKPNHFELGELTGRELDPADHAALADAARALQDKGARNVLVSLAGDGAMLLAEDRQVLCRPAAKGRVLNSSGAGDSMVAGFLAGFAWGGYAEALKLGTASGGATAFSEGLATKAEIESVYRSLDETKRAPVK